MSAVEPLAWVAVALVLAYPVLALLLVPAVPGTARHRRAVRRG